MDRETLVDAIKQGPVRITMNDGRTFDVPSLEFATVDSMAAYVLTKTDDNKYRARILSLVTMVSIEPLVDAA